MHPVEIKIVAALDSDPKLAMSLLYDHYSDALFGVITRIVSDEDAAADVLQETMIKVWKNASSYDSSKSRLFTWLLRIARNTAIDKVRSSQRNPTTEIQEAITDVGKHSSSLNVETLDIGEQVSKLEDKYAVIIDAMFFKGMTQAETSEALDIPLGTVKTRLKIAMRELRKIYVDALVLILAIFGIG